MGDTSIEWTDKTWNPVVGCQKISEGCRNCYAKTLHDKRHEAVKRGAALPMQYSEPFEKIQLMPERLGDPLKWRKPQRVFVNSVSDLFHKDVPFEFIDQVFGVMAKAYWHTFQVLTKRPERMAEYLSHRTGPWNVLTRIIQAAQQFEWPKSRYAEINAGAGWDGFPYPNIHLGTSVENQQAADERIPHLLRVPAAVRFLSCEPLLGAVNLKSMTGCKIPIEAERCDCFPSGIHWVIVGGESGPGARPMHPDWARSLRDQCQSAGVPFFFKQWGEWSPDAPVLSSDRTMKARPDGHVLSQSSMTIPGTISLGRIGKKAAGRLLDGRTWDEFPAAKGGAA